MGAILTSRRRAALPAGASFKSAFIAEYSTSLLVAAALMAERPFV
jgi:hypothetical protein